MFKKLIVSLSVVSMLLVANAQAFAESTIGYVDMNRVLQSYSKAQDVAEDFKVKQEGLRKQIEDARAKLSTIENEEERKQLESKMAKELHEKNEAIKLDYTKKVQSLQANITKAIQKVATEEKVATVLSKNEVLAGGVDLTDNVLKSLKK